VAALLSGLGAAAGHGQPGREHAPAQQACAVEATGAAAQSARDDETAGPVRIPADATRYPVQFASAEQVGDHCRYEASVRGVIALVPHGRAPERAHYQPDLRIAAQLRCPAAPAESTGERVLRHPLASQLALVQAIDERGEIVRDEAGHVCIYSPHFRFDAGQLRVADVSRACTLTARGGGPP
jgi:hypothetical protein